MKKRKERVNKEADKFVDDINAGKKSSAAVANVEVKPEVVKNMPDDMGRHGSDQETDLNPEE